MIFGMVGYSRLLQGPIWCPGGAALHRNELPDVTSPAWRNTSGCIGLRRDRHTVSVVTHRRLAPPGGGIVANRSLKTRFF